MFPTTIILRVTALREEEDYLFTDQWIEREAKTRFGSNGPPHQDYKALCKEAPRKIKLLATLAITVHKDNFLGTVEQEVTDTENPPKIGEEAAYILSSYPKNSPT